VARAARRPRQQARRLGLLALASACALAQEPPGGPPDATPPTVRSIRPDSGAVLPGFRDPVVFEFDEIVSERSAGRLDELFFVSPRSDRVRVSWKRSRLEVRPADGWRPDAVYRVTLLPGAMDLRNNRMRQGAEVVFSTGPAIPDTRLTGTVVNWTTARPAARALVEAIGPDSVIYFAQADSTGDFLLWALPAGPYVLVATIDQNSNRRRDRREAFDSAVVVLDSTAALVLWAFEHDSVGPQLRSAERVDSLTVRLTFNQSLLPGEPAPDAVSVRLLPDSLPVAVAALWSRTTYDSVRVIEQAAADSARAVADSLRAVADTTPRDTTRAVSPARPTAAPRDPGRPRTAGPAQPDTGRIAMLLRQRPALSDALVVRLAAPLQPGSRYLFEARATNPNGATNTGRAVLAVPDTAGTAAR